MKDSDTFLQKNLGSRQLLLLGLMYLVMFNDILIDFSEKVSFFVFNDKRPKVFLHLLWANVNGRTFYFNLK